MVKLGNTSGFSYPAVLIVLVIMAASAQRVLIDKTLQARRQIELNIVAQGEAFVWALESYWISGGASPELPQTVEQLLSDPRQGFMRHLRSDLTTPFEGDKWEPIYNSQNRIKGVRLNSSKPPVRKVLVAGDGRKVNLNSYADWVFEFTPTSEH